MLSVHTNFASLVAQNSVNNSNSMLSNAIERLSTGLRINSAADDAAGLQIATRMQANVTGMKAAQRNISDATSMLQTADGALAELTNITNRQKELATQAANGVNSAKDLEALDAEYQELTKESTRILTATKYADNDLFGVLAAGVKFQIGADATEVLTVTAAKPDPTGLGTALDSGDNARAALAEIKAFDVEVGTARSLLGANINRLSHTSSNMANVIQNTTAAAGRIMDADFASESAAMTKNQMLVQAGTTVLSKSNQNTGLVMGLLR